MRIISATLLGALALSVVGVIVLGLVVPAPAATPARMETVDELVVALHLPAPGLQAGAVRGNRVVAARGLEIDVARAVARRLGARTIRFVNVADVRTLTRPGAKTWDVALAGIDVRAGGAAKLSIPYLLSDPVVLLRPGLSRPRTLADLRLRQLCAVAGGGGETAARRIRSSGSLLEAHDDTELLRLVETGRCDAAVQDAPSLGTALERTGARHGRIGGRIDTGAAFAVALPPGSELDAAVDRAVTKLRRNGTLGRIAERWLGFDPARIRVLTSASA
jgi:polar amino acid transport system substrate-binding protein